MSKSSEKGQPTLTSGPLMDWFYVHAGYINDDTGTSEVWDVPQGIELAIQPGEKSEALIVPDRPWEREGISHLWRVYPVDGKFRMHYRTRDYHLIAESEDGFHFRVRPEPFLVPAVAGVFAEYEEYGVEDPRICHLNDDYLITYSAYSRHGVRVALARTRDFQSLERVAFVTDADSRNVVIFPERYWPVRDPFVLINAFGVPLNTTFPPFRPAPGPMSMT